MPKVSIIVNCFNGSKYLKEALDSIYSQTFHDWEIIFYDNQSNDGSAEIAKSYDFQLKYFKSESLISLGAARADAVLKAEGEWVAFLDTDDLWYPEKLEIQLNALDGTDYDLCYAGVREISSFGQKIRDVYPTHGSGKILEKLLLQFDINMVTPMFRRDILSKWGLNFDANIYASEEYNLFVRIAAKGKVLAQQELLGEYRVYLDSLTNKQISKWATERRYTLNQLKSENINIQQQYPDALREAEARGTYYEARYLMSEGRSAEARRIMSGISQDDSRYRLLFFLTFIPPLWIIIHSPWIRRVMISFLSPLLFKFHGR
jgi:glycosyltransferase involved in cell wall biosynthesis